MPIRAVRQIGEIERQHRRMRLQHLSLRIEQREEAVAMLTRQRLVARAAAAMREARRLALEPRRDKGIGGIVEHMRQQQRQRDRHHQHDHDLPHQQLAEQGTGEAEDHGVESI